MFDSIESQTTWDISRPMLWGFFFIDDSPEKLQRAGRELEKRGYRFVKIYQDDPKINWWLHVEREEVHTVDSLHARNVELSVFARETGLKDYDGNDVGPLVEK